MGCKMRALIFVQCLVLCYAQDCKISIVDNFKNILLLKAEKNEFLMPEHKDGIIHVKHGSNIHLSCPGSHVNGFANGDQTLPASCKGGTTFMVETQRLSANEIECSKPPEVTEKEAGTCQKAKIEIGFKMPSNFLSQIDVCYDKSLVSPLYAHSVLTNQIGHCRSTTHTWLKGEYFTREMEDKYLLNEQVKTAQAIFPSKNYIDSTNFFEKAHLIPSCDFIYEPVKALTYSYRNVAPMWSTINKGNWALLESRIRRYVAAGKSDMDIYSGTYGILELENSSGKKSKVFLYYDPPMLSMPVPEYFWKVLIRKSDKKGVAFIGYNNVHDKPVTTLCKNIMSKLNWVNAKDSSRVPPRGRVSPLRFIKHSWASKTSGYVMACDVEEFKKISGLQNQLPVEMSAVKTTGILGISRGVFSSLGNFFG